MHLKFAYIMHLIYVTIYTLGKVTFQFNPVTHDITIIYQKMFIYKFTVFLDNTTISWILNLTPQQLVFLIMISDGQKA